MFNKLIKLVQIDVGEKLGSEIPNRKAAFALSLSWIFGFKAVNNLRTKPKRLNIFNPTHQNFFEYLMVNRVEKFSNIALQSKTWPGIIPACFSGRIFHRRNAFMRSFANAAGKGIGNKGRLKNWT